MASLTGTKIKDTYDSLLKVSDNGALGASAKQITDGLGNSSGVYLGTSGNVGIGVSPSAKFHAQVSSETTIGIFENTAGKSFNILNDVNKVYLSEGTSSTTNSFIINGTDNQLEFRTNGSEKMRIDSSGNVGIGVSPTATLDIRKSGSTAAQGDTDLLIEDSGAAGSTAQVQILGGASGYSNLYFSDTSAYNVGGFIYNHTNNYLATNVNGSERMRITSGGYLKASNDGTYLNATASYHEQRNSSNGNQISQITHSGNSTPFGLGIGFTGSAPNNTTQWFLRAGDSSVDRFYVYSNGNVVNTNNSYGAISDAKLKENIVDASPKLDDLMQVQVRNFNYIGDDKKQLGIVAQELETIFPAMIDESPDFEEREVELRDENGEIVYETEQVLVSEEVAEVTEEVLHEAIAEELDEDGNVIVEAQEAWTETVIVTPFQAAVYETVATDVPVMTTEKFDLGTTTKSVKYSVFVPMLIKAIQELKAEVDALKGA